MKLVIEIVKAIKDLKGHWDTIDKFSKATDRARRGRDPFPPPRQVKRVLSAHEEVRDSLDRIARSGPEAPALPAVGAPQLANPASRGGAARDLRRSVEIRRAHVEDLQKLLAAIQALQREAQLKAVAAREIRDFWKELMKAPLPDLGTLNRTTYFEYYRIFERLSGSLGNVARAAGRAAPRVRRDLDAYRTETNNLAANLRTFGL